MIRNEELECFILGFGLEMPDEGLGRPVALPALWLAAKEKCGECDMNEVLDALYNLNPDHAELYKFVPLDEKYQAVSFERKRHTAKWKDFFYGDSFRIKVLPAGRVRFQKLSEELAEQQSLGSASMKVSELASRVQKFHDELETHFDLWSQSLQQPIPDYPVRNIEKLREQTNSLARQLGTLRPYIERFMQSTIMTVMGQRWDAYDCAVSNDVSVRKGPSIEAVLPQLQQMLGRLESMNQEEPAAPAEPARERGGPRAGITQYIHGNVNQAIATDRATQNVGQIGPSGNSLDEIVKLLQQSYELTRRQMEAAIGAAQQLDAETKKPEGSRNWKSIAEWGNTLLSIAGKATDLTETLAPHLPWITALVEKATHHG